MAPHRAWIKKIDGEPRVTLRDGGVGIDILHAGGQGRHIEAGHLVAASGSGNEALLAQLRQPPSAAQRRPLRMVMIERAPGPLWAHCFDASDKPRVTITTHRRQDGTLVWYVGGQLAETGVRQSPAELIAAAKAEFAQLLPTLDISGRRFATYAIDRAEGATGTGAKPDGPVLRRAGRAWFAWPTKLALTPQLAELVLADLPSPQVSFDPAVIADWAAPAFADPPWEQASWS